MSFLQKPFNLKAIAQKVREVLDGVPEHAGFSGAPKTIRRLLIVEMRLKCGLPAGKFYKIMTV